jgi:hypothetical protein
MYAQSQQNGKPKKIKIFEGKKTKGPKQHSQIWLMLPLPEEQTFSFNHEYIIKEL